MIETILNKYNSSNKGLSSKQAEVNKKYGINVLQSSKPDSFVKKFFLQFKNLMIIVLLISALISTIVSLATKTYEDLFEGAIIFAIVIVNAIIGVIQEHKAETALALLNNKSAPHTKVYRDGKIVVLESSEIVVGDVILLRSGDFVPADVVLMESTDLKTDESALTGESQNVDKDHTAYSDSSTPLAEKRNMCFSSTSVTSGNAKAVVVAVGKNTEIGKIAKLLAVKRDKTPLEKNMEKIGKVITYGVLVVVAIVFLTQLIFSSKFDFMQAFLTAIALAVAAIPESLPAVITIIMALGVEKLAKHGAIVKTLNSVETLGSCTCLCTDKTGTLTQNKMVVKNLYIDDQIISDNFGGNTFDLLLSAISCCNNAQESSTGFSGDATETSLKYFVKKQNSSKLNIGIKIKEIAFDSTRKIMSTLTRINDKTYVFSKGALEFLIKKCIYVLVDGNIVKLNENIISKIESAHSKMANLGERIIAVAYKEENNLTEDNLILLGLVGIIDPPRKEVSDSIKQCFSAGLKPIMITGDHPDTAFAIAKQLNIAHAKSQVITGSEIQTLSSRSLAKIIDNYSVFARVSPTDKTKIVSALKQNGHIVGFAGDGINDAPSVKSADIGVCMGSGTDVTKSASDLIISTNDYSTIVLAIKQGRTIYSNIQKTLLFLISTNMVEVLGLFISAIVFPSASFLLPSQILFINLVTDSLPAFALGLEKPEKDIMQKPPLDPSKNIFSGIGWPILLQGFTQTLVVLVMFVVAICKWGNTVASTMVFITICLMQLIHSINCKTLRSITKINIFNNKTFNISFVSLLALILIVGLLPMFQILFGLSALNGIQWLVVVLTSVAIIPVVEVCKFILNHPPKTKLKIRKHSKLATQ